MFATLLRRARGRAPFNAVLWVLIAGSLSCDSVVGSGDSIAPVWRVALESADANTETTPATDGHRLYVIGGAVFALDVQNGARLWTYRPSGETSRPRNILVRNGRLFFAGKIAFGVDAASGAELWRLPLPIPAGTDASLGHTAVDESTFYVGTDSHQVFAIDQATGALRWSTDIGPDWRFRGIVRGITVSGDTLFVSAHQFNAENGYISTGWIFGLDRATGRTIWSFRNGSGSDWRTVSAPVNVAGRLLFASDLLSGSAFAVDRFTGQEVWRRTGPANKFGPLASPIVVDGTAYYASEDTYVYAVDAATGVERWKRQNSASNFSFAVCGSRVFTNYQSLAILDRSDGHVLYRSRDADIFSEFAVTGGRAFALSNRAVYAYDCS
jgi:outer membrane protein assembly factor BamB